MWGQVKESGASPEPKGPSGSRTAGTTIRAQTVRVGQAGRNGHALSIRLQRDLATQSADSLTHSRDAHASSSVGFAQPL